MNQTAKMTKSIQLNTLTKAFVAVFMSVLFVQTASAQKIKFGPRVSFGTSDVTLDELIVKDANDLDELAISLKDASPEIGIGGFARFQLLGLYVQPELLISTSSITLNEQNIPNGTSQDRKERFYNLEAPIMVGTKLGPLRAQAGPVFRAQLDSKSELFDIAGYPRQFQESSVGARAGIGIDLGKKLVVDLTYEANLSQIRDQVTIMGNTYNLSERQSQVVLSVGLAL